MEKKICTGFIWAKQGMLTLSFLLFEISFWNPAYLYFGKLAFEQYVFLNFNSSLTTLTDQEQGGGNRQGTKSPQKWKKKKKIP